MQCVMIHQPIGRSFTVLSFPRPHKTLKEIHVFAPKFGVSVLSLFRVSNGDLPVNEAKVGADRFGVKIVDGELLPNATKKKRNPNFRGGFSLGVDIGGSRTGVAVSKGFVPRPLTVLELRGHKLESRLLEIAAQEKFQEADELIIGIPISGNGKETSESNKIRSIVGRLAIQAAERGWRVYLQDEHGTSQEALDLMIDMGVNKSDRKDRVDAYAAMMVLHRYFASSGCEAELVLPKSLELQEKLRRGPPKDLDFLGDDEFCARFDDFSHD
ncbi:hypothetical protein AMTRI_Chr13g116690 [Amborella trichopoda]